MLYSKRETHNKTLLPQWEALEAGFARLSEEEKKAVLSKTCDMCIFDAKDVQPFEEALKARRGR